MKTRNKNHGYHIDFKSLTKTKRISKTFELPECIHVQIYIYIINGLVKIILQISLYLKVIIL